METIHLTDLVKVSGQGQSITIRGATVTRKADSADTNGAWALLEYHAPAHFDGPALHWHAETTEAFYVLDGTLTFVIADQTITAGPGTSILVPPGVWHTFLNATAEPVAFLTFCSPGGFEQYFPALQAAATEAGGLSPEVIGPLWEQYGIGVSEV